MSRESVEGKVASTILTDQGKVETEEPVICTGRDCGFKTDSGYLEGSIYEMMGCVRSE
jgi:hypothetical protein